MVNTACGVSAVFPRCHLLRRIAAEGRQLGFLQGLDGWRETKAEKFRLVDWLLIMGCSRWAPDGVKTEVRA